MINKTVALHGTKELLQQARKDLVAAGFEDDKEWNDLWHLDDMDYLLLDGYIEYQSYNGHYDNVINLTSENYLEEINKIISKKQQKH